MLCEVMLNSSKSRSRTDLDNEDDINQLYTSAINDDTQLCWYSWKLLGNNSIPLSWSKDNFHLGESSNGICDLYLTIFSTSGSFKVKPFGKSHW